MTSDGISRMQLAITYLFLAILMFYQAVLSNIKHAIPFRVFTLIYTSQLLFTPVFSAVFKNKIIFNRWMIISLFFAIITGSFILYTFSARSPVYRGKKQMYKGIYGVLVAAFLFSIILCQKRIIFDFIGNLSTNKKQQPSFAVVLELLIFLSLFATVISVAAVFITGEHHDLERQMNGFSKGEAAYMRTLVGQAIPWQVYLASHLISI
ncbi:hypothetical protein Bca4012_057953 [Brassica carinata]|uniref:Uncharacterized protein n=1 Tax=Brassica carinata TaxID=52824 RepID=A0A8X7PMT2_BRACI|nr:hypothetical protein Bca52824_084496 [Brassica carinata]